MTQWDDNLPQDTKPQDGPLLFETACGGTLDDPTGFPSAIYKGQRVYFCTRACLRVYLSDPDGFMSGAIPHPIDEL